MENARFWIWHSPGGTWVKLTLRPGDVLEHHTGGATDEGWDSEWGAWSHEGDHVRFEWVSDGADCDGRMTNGGASVCPIGDLRARRDRYTGGRAVPVWRSEDDDEWRRDHAAEAAGY
tara:strand:+ start:806 stop:1156 length:351 start_codon:yes stop_codon:yes gene_type:complete